MKSIAALGAGPSIALLVLTAGCGADGGDTALLDGYFRQVEAALVDQSQQLAEVGDPNISEDDVLDEREQQVVADMFGAQLEILRDLHSALGELDPPADVRDAHNEALAALADTIALWESVLPKFEAVDTVTELEEVGRQVEGPEAAAIFERALAACSALQAVADDNGIDADLMCAG